MLATDHASREPRYTAIFQLKLGRKKVALPTNVRVAGGSNPFKPSLSLSTLVKPRPLLRDGVFITV